MPIHRRSLIAPMMATIALAACGGPGPSAGARPEAPPRALGVSGQITHHPKIGSRHLPHDRDVWVYVPPGYADEPERRYPVLYMHDGNNAFDPAIAFGGHDWQLDEHAERLIRAGEVAPVIIVAVANSPDRIQEYSWIPGPFQGGVQGGWGPRYARFLIEELKPMIDRRYRTRPGRDDTAVMGSSMGGLISLYLGRHHGDTFGRIGAVSPALFWARRAILDEARAMPKDLIRLWLDMGVYEERELAPFKHAIRDTRELRRRLERRGYEVDRTLGYYEDPDGWHNEQTWARRVPMILKFLFPAS